MGKPSKRAGREARDVHEAIRADAESLKGAARFGMRDADEFPELAELMHAGREAVAAAVPGSLVFKGRTYWLRARLAVQLDIFAAPGDAAPLVSGLSLSTDDHGHAPGH